MPKRRGTHSNLTKNTGFTQHSCSLPLSSVRRATLALPGRAPQVGEAELLPGVTQASAEPLIGAIPSGPLDYSKTEGLSPHPTESDIGNSRLDGMGRLPDGFSHLTSESDKNPLRNNILEPLLMPAPSPSGDIPAEQPLILATSGFDPTTIGVYGLSVMGIDERQEGAKEHATDSDTINPHSIDSSLYFANNVSRPISIIDKSYIKPHTKHFLYDALLLRLKNFAFFKFYIHGYCLKYLILN